jgi:hypothetical protein
MSGHVKEKKVTFFGAQDSLVNETFCEALADLLQLETDFHHIPRFTFT